MRTFLLVCLAGAAGTGLRHLINVAVAESSRPFPYGTLAINIAGSFLMGLLVPLALKRAWPVPIISMIVTGFLGGFTTYSRFNFDLTVYFAAGQWMKAFAYLALTVLGGLAAGFLGFALAK
jgi:fluoride exporter